MGHPAGSRGNPWDSTVLLLCIVYTVQYYLYNSRPAVMKGADEAGRHERRWYSQGTENFDQVRLAWVRTQRYFWADLFSSFNRCGAGSIVFELVGYTIS